MAAGQLYKVAYDEAVRTLSEQQAAIDSFRNRAGILLSATAITTSFLGAQALHGRANSFSWCALACFVGVAAFSLASLWPRQREVAANPNKVIATYIESAEPTSIEELHRELSIHMNGSHLENRKDFGKLVVFFQIASVLLVIEVALWIIAIATTT